MGNNGGYKRKVNKICMETGNILGTFNSTACAARHIGPTARQGNISSACRGRYKHAYGFIWKYVPPRVCDNEIWKPINNIPKYQISTYGRVKTPKGEINDLVDNPIVSAYPRVGIRGKLYRRHILVAQHFIQNPDKKDFVNYIDGDRQNCHVSNLEWCTHSENMEHAHATGLNPTSNNVIVENTLTGQKRNFHSMASASNFFGMNRMWLGQLRTRRKSLNIQYKNFSIELNF